MTKTLFTFRASSAPAWLECSLREAIKVTRPADPRAVVSVAAEYGRAVHAHITGQAHEPAQYVDFDEVTPTRRALRRQIIEGVLNAERALANYDIFPVATEEELTAKVPLPGMADTFMSVVGHIDMVSDTTYGRFNIIDLKTGRMDPVKVWPQLAVYAWLADAHDWKIDNVIVVSVPRGMSARHVEVLRKDGADMIAYGAQIVQEIGASGVNAMARPGLHCHSCTAFDCMFHPNPGGLNNE